MTAVAPETAPHALTADERRVQHIKALVDAAPPLSASQRAKLTVLLNRRTPAGKAGSK